MSTPYTEAKPEVWAVHSHDPSGVSDQHSRVEKQPAVHEEAPLSVPEFGIEISQDERALVSGSVLALVRNRNAIHRETVAAAVAMAMATAMSVANRGSIDAST